MHRIPHVSVIIPTYNRASYLVEALASVLDQSYGDFEVIVADDGSTDETAERVAAVDGPIRYLPLAHSGRPSVARNRALATARGDLIAFLDDDDRWRPDKLQRQVALLDRDPDLGFVYSDVRFMDADETVSPPVLTPAQKQRGFIFDYLLDDCFIFPSTVVVRRGLLDRIGWFDETFPHAEDYELWLRLAYVAPAGFHPEPLVTLRRHSGGMSQSPLPNYRYSVTALERVRTTLRLSLGQRVRLQRALGRMHTHVGLLLLAQDEYEDARRHFLHALRSNPFQRRAWPALVATYRNSRRS